MGNTGFSIKDCFDLAAQRVGIERWEGYRWQTVDCGFIVTGCAPSGYYSRGPKKGKPKFRPPAPGTQRTVVISEGDALAFALDHEAKTGECFRCKGSGQEFAGWSAETGIRTRDCVRCGATGKATGGTP